jgi:uncharacterized membrane protein YfcA
MNLAAILGAIAIGLSLGLTGAGGSILTLPVLVYLAGVPPQEAVGLSLFIVGIAAAVGAVERARAGDFHRRAALMFGGGGMLGAVVGARFTPLVPAWALMGGFGLLMAVVAVRMLGGPAEDRATAPDCRVSRCLVAGVGTGVLTGFVGVGGGFLLMPALMRFARLQPSVATGTSLAVIALNATIGWISHLPGSAARMDLMLLFGGLAVGGIVLGRRLAARLPAKRLRQGFGIMALVVGLTILWKSVGPLVVA